MPLHVILVIALLLCNVLLRTFTNGLGIVPKIFNVVDLGIVGLLFLIFLSRKGEVTPPAWAMSVRRRLLVFCLVLVAGCVLNLGYFFMPAVLSQTAMLVTPLLLFVAVVNLPFTEGQIGLYTRILKRLIIFEIIVGILQLPIRFKTADSEAVHGTFPGNAEQYAAFLIIGVFYLIGLALLNPEKRKRYALAIFFILVLTLSIDNKASWLGIVCSLGFVLWQLGGLRSKLLRVVGLVAMIGILGLFVGFIASKTSNTLYKFDLLFEAIRTDNFRNLGKVKAYVDIARSHFSNPHMLVVGAGPSNFYSRGSRQFYFRPSQRAKMYLNPNDLSADRKSSDSGRASDSMGGILTMTLQVPYYSQFYSARDAIFAVGSIQVDSPFSPYAGLIGETGILGSFLYLSIYLIALRRLVLWLREFRHDPVITPLLVSALGFMVYVLVNSIYGPFIETTRLSTILWSMVALASIYVRLQHQKEADEQPEMAAELQPVAHPWAAKESQPVIDA